MGSNPRAICGRPL